MHHPHERAAHRDGRQPDGRRALFRDPAGVRQSHQCVCQRRRGRTRGRAGGAVRDTDGARHIRGIRHDGARSRALVVLPELRGIPGRLHAQAAGAVQHHVRRAIRADGRRGPARARPGGGARIRDGIRALRGRQELPEPRLPRPLDEGARGTRGLQPLALRLLAREQGVARARRIYEPAVDARAERRHSSPARRHRRAHIVWLLCGHAHVAKLREQLRVAQPRRARSAESGRRQRELDAEARAGGARRVCGVAIGVQPIHGRDAQSEAGA